MTRPKIDNARASLRKSKRTDATKIEVTRGTMQTMEGTSTFAGSPELQAAGQRWKDAALALKTNGAKVGALKVELALAQNQQRIHRRTWEVATQHVLAVVTTVAHGLGDVVQELGFDVQTRSAGLVEAPGEGYGLAGRDSGEVTFQWTCASARNGYVVQTATNSSDPSTYSQVVPCTRTKFTVRHQAPRATVYFRVAAVDPASTSGQSRWSDWISASAR